MTVTYKENQWRLADRVRLPAWVLIDGEKYAVNDWSFSGFSIEKTAAVDRFDKEKPVDLTFILPFGHYAAQCALQAEPRVTGDDSAGFEFCHVPEGVRLLMREYVEEFVEGRLEGREPGFQQNVSIVSTDRQPQTDVAPDPFIEKDFRKKLIRYAFFAAVVLLLVGILLWSQRFVISTQAGLLGNTAEIRTRTDGFIKEMPVRSGDQVKSGQLIIQLDDQEPRRNLKAASFMQQRLEASVQVAAKALEDEKKNDKFYARVASGRLKIEQAKQSESESILAQSAADMKRAESLHQRGFVSEAGLTDRLYLLRQREASLSRAKSETGLAAEIANEAKGGHFFSDRQVANRVNEMALLLETQQIQHAQSIVALGTLIDALAYTRIVAPQEGKVRLLTRSVGELVRVGDLLATMETTAEPYVLARFSGSDAVRISPGQSARVYFPTLDRVLKGSVDSIGGQGQTGNAGLLSAAESNVDDVLVNVRLEPLEQPIPGGLRARVEVDTGLNLWIQLRQRMQ